MPKASTRFRNRKINFKTRIGIRIGALEAPSDHEDEDGFHFEDDRGVGSSSGLGGAAQGGDKDRHHVETGVDKAEEQEHHLQVVINASAAALSRHGGAEPRSLVAQAQGKAAEPNIPIPDATGVVEQEVYDALYKRDFPFALPSTYIRFSDTVEEATGGVTYCLDEEDESWLENFNAGPPSTSTSANGAAEGSSSSLNGNSQPANETGRGRRGSPRKGKEKEKSSSPRKEEVNGSAATGPGKLEEDDFELLMDTFEKVTDETVPGLHLVRSPQTACLCLHLWLMCEVSGMHRTRLACLRFRISKASYPTPPSTCGYLRSRSLHSSCIRIGRSVDSSEEANRLYPS